MRTHVEHIRKLAVFVVLSMLAAGWCRANNTWYVDAARPDDTGPGTDWSTAFKTIQAAVNHSSAGDTVLVAAGMYDSGGVLAGDQALTNRVAITNAITVKSADNDPETTIIKGAWDSESSLGPGPAAIRCVYMVSGAVLSGFTLTNGATMGEEGGTGNNTYGGGVWCESPSAVISNCVIVGNVTGWRGGGVYNGTVHNSEIIYNSAARVSGDSQPGGGGAYQSVLHRCKIGWNNAASGTYPRGGGVRGCTVYSSLIIGNRATNRGGAGVSSTFYNCAIVGNAQVSGGTVRESYLQNCIVDNSGTINDHGCTFSHSCLDRDSSGTFLDGNIQADPLFVDPGSGTGLNHVEGDYRLQKESPCIDAGQNEVWMRDRGDPRSWDFDGEPRVYGGVVDMGAYELGFHGTIFRMW